MPRPRWQAAEIVESMQDNISEKAQLSPEPEGAVGRALPCPCPGKTPPCGGSSPTMALTPSHATWYSCLVYLAPLDRGLALCAQEKVVDVTV